MAHGEFGMEVIVGAWAIHICRPAQVPVVEELGLTERCYQFRYAAIEEEPSLPWTRYSPHKLYEQVTDIPAPKGRLGNAQTHALQLPHIYCFSHFARGGTPQSVDLPGFAEKLVPELGAAIAAGWRAMSEESVAEDIEAALARLRGTSPGRGGELEGLLFGSGERFLEDLRSQLRLRRVERQMQSAVSTDAAREALQKVCEPLGEWCGRHGFGDYGSASVLTHIRRSAERIGAREILKQFETGPAIEHRHGFTAPAVQMTLKGLRVSFVFDSNNRESAP